MYRSRPAAIPASMAGICAALDRKEGAPQAASIKLGTIKSQAPLGAHMRCACRRVQDALGRMPECRAAQDVQKRHGDKKRLPLEERVRPPLFRHPAGGGRQPSWLLDEREAVVLATSCC
jgi:hypothetical protein